MALTRKELHSFQRMLDDMTATQLMIQRQIDSHNERLKNLDEEVADLTSFLQEYVGDEYKNGDGADFIGCQGDPDKLLTVEDVLSNGIAFECLGGAHDFQGDGFDGKEPDTAKAAWPANWNRGWEGSE